jgi:hypothetical protein
MKKQSKESLYNYSEQEKNAILPKVVFAIGKQNIEELELGVKLFSKFSGFSKKEIYENSSFLFLASSYYSIKDHSIKEETIEAIKKHNIKNLFFGGITGRPNIIVTSAFTGNNPMFRVKNFESLLLFGKNIEEDSSAYGTVYRTMVYNHSPIQLKPVFHNIYKDGNELACFSDTETIIPFLNQHSLKLPVNISNKTIDKEEVIFYYNNCKKRLISSASYGRKSRIWQDTRDFDIITFVASASTIDFDKSFNFVLEKRKEKILKPIETIPLTEPKASNAASMLVGGMGVFTKKIFIEGIEHIIKGALFEERISEPVQQTDGSVVNEIAIGYRDIVAIYRQDTREFVQLQ